MDSFQFDGNEGFAGFNDFAMPATPADGCTQCGICLPACPTFQQSGDPQQSPMGRIRIMRLLQDGDIDETARQSLQSCLGCYACESRCPSRVDYRGMLDAALDKVATPPPITRRMMRLSLKPLLRKTLISLMATAQAIGIRQLMRWTGLFRIMGLARADKLAGQVSLPKTLHSPLQRPRSDQRVNLFRGCFSSELEQELQQDIIELLNTLGIEVVIPEQQVCCGALHRHNGDSQTAQQLARQNHWVFKLHPAAATIFTSSGCGSSLQDYGKWLALEDYEAPHPIMDASHFVYDLLRQRRPLFNTMPIKVALHTPCSLKHGEGQVEAVTEILRMIPQLEIHTLSGTPACCGAGGTQMLSHPQQADGLRDVIIDELKTLQPQVLLTSNLGCSMHLQAGLREHKLDIAIQHPLQLIAQALQVEFVSVRRQAS